MSEAQYLVLGWLYTLMGAFVAALAFAAGLWVLFGVWVLMFLIGIAFLVRGFMIYQWPNREEYIQFWHDMIWMHMPPKRGVASSTH